MEKYEETIIPLKGVERVTEKLLSVLWTKLTNFDSHASNMLEDCSRTMHVIKHLKSRGLQKKIFLLYVTH